MAYEGRNNIYEAAIKRMVAKALDQQEQEFFLIHGADTDEQLLAYMVQCAKELGHTPWPREIMGGGLIEERFGTRQTLLSIAKLPAPSIPDKVSGFARYQEETERQKILCREKKAAKRQQAQKEKQKQLL